MASHILSHTKRTGKVLLRQHLLARSTQILRENTGSKNSGSGSIVKREQKHEVEEKAPDPQVELEELVRKGQLTTMDALTKVPNEQKMQYLTEDFDLLTERLYDKFTLSNWATLMDVGHMDWWTFAKFDSEKAVKNWKVSTDRDSQRGYSSAKFELSENKTGIFHGYLNTSVPKTGEQNYAGFCNISSPTPKVAFRDRRKPMGWSGIFNHLCVRLRGDGRTYMLVLQMHSIYHDLTYYDQFHYPLHTRGGPYWQITKIPFSKFYLASYGRVQDKQYPITKNLDQVESVRITLGDGNTGPFKLEIDFIALLRDENHREISAYEMYQTERGQAGF